MVSPRSYIVIYYVPLLFVSCLCAPLLRHYCCISHFYLLIWQFQSNGYCLTDTTSVCVCLLWWDFGLLVQYNVSHTRESCKMWLQHVNDNEEMRTIRLRTINKYFASACVSMDSVFIFHSAAQNRPLWAGICFKLAKGPGPPLLLGFQNCRMVTKQ